MARSYGNRCLTIPIPARSRAMTTIRLSPDDRYTLLEHYRRDPDPQVRLRAPLLRLLADGHTWATIASVLFTSPDTIARWQGRFERGGVDALLGRPRGRPRSVAWAWAVVVGGGVEPPAGRVRLRPQPLELRGGGGAAA